MAHKPFRPRPISVAQTPSLAPRTAFSVARRRCRLCATSLFPASTRPRWTVPADLAGSILAWDALVYE